jgi:hypothetical protein
MRGQTLYIGLRSLRIRVDVGVLVGKPPPFHVGDRIQVVIVIQNPFLIRVNPNSYYVELES